MHFFFNGSSSPFKGQASYSVRNHFSQTVGLLGQVISPSQGRYLNTGQHKQNKRTQTSMPRVGFEPTIPASERVKTIHALDRATTVTGLYIHTWVNLTVDKVKIKFIAFIYCLLNDAVSISDYARWKGSVIVER
jgi:hypothetical protein